MFGWFKYCFSHYFDLTGRASRTEFWSFLFIWLLIQLIFIIVGILGAASIGVPANESEAVTAVASYLTIYVQYQAISFIYFIATLLPLIAVTVRRLHDRDISGWWVLVAFFLSFFLLGFFILLVLLIIALLPSSPQPNKYGLRAPSSPTDVVPNQYQYNPAAAYNVQKDASGLAQIGGSGAYPQQTPSGLNVQSSNQPRQPNSSSIEMSNETDRNKSPQGTQSLLDEMRSGKATKEENDAGSSSTGSSTHRPMAPQESSLISSLRNKSKKTDESKS